MNRLLFCRVPIRPLWLIFTIALGFLLSETVLGQCDQAKTLANLSANQLVKCLEYEPTNSDKQWSSRRDVILELHRRGSAVVPDLIDDFSNTKKIFVHLDDPRSSHRRPMEIPCGLVSAYIVELILSRETLIRSKDDYAIYSLSVVGVSPENYPYWDGAIRNSRNELIGIDDLPKIQKLYREWWEKNKRVPLPDLRKAWKNGERVLGESEYKWT